MDQELRKQLALMIGQQAIEVVEHMLLHQAKDQLIAELRQDKRDVEDHRDLLENQLRELGEPQRVPVDDQASEPQA